MPRTIKVAGVEVARIGLGTNRLTPSPENLAFLREAADRYQQKGATGLLGSDVSELLARFGFDPATVQRRIGELTTDVAGTMGKTATTLLTATFSLIFVFVLVVILEIVVFEVVLFLFLVPLTRSHDSGEREHGVGATGKLALQTQSLQKINNVRHEKVSLEYGVVESGVEA